MKKLCNSFIIGLMAGFVVSSAILVTPLQLAQASIKTDQLENNSITSPKIENGEVKTQDLSPVAVSVQIKTRIGESVTVAPGEFEEAEANCNSDEQITGGGAAADGSIVLAAMRALGTVPPTWVVAARNIGNTDGGFRAEVQCLKVVP